MVSCNVLAEGLSKWPRQSIWSRHRFAKCHVTLPWFETCELLLASLLVFEVCVNITIIIINVDMNEFSNINVSMNA